LYRNEKNGVSHIASQVLTTWFELPIEKKKLSISTWGGRRPSNPCGYRELHLSLENTIQVESFLSSLSFDKNKGNFIVDVML